MTSEVVDSEEISEDKINNFQYYRLYGHHTALELLRPGAKWKVVNFQITEWDDPRPKPTWEQVEQVMQKIKEFEESIETIWLPEQLGN